MQRNETTQLSVCLPYPYDSGDFEALLYLSGFYCENTRSCCLVLWNFCFFFFLLWSGFRNTIFANEMYTKLLPPRADNMWRLVLAVLVFNCPDRWAVNRTFFGSRIHRGGNNKWDEIYSNASHTSTFLVCNDYQMILTRETNLKWEVPPCLRW